MIVLANTATGDNLAAKQDVGADVNFDVNGAVVSTTTGLVSDSLHQQGALSTTATSLTGTPGANTMFVIGSILLTNTGASTRTITVYLTENSVTYAAGNQWGATIVLGANESAEWDGQWLGYDSNGRVLGTIIAATQSDQETATSLTTFVSPGRQQYHPSAPKAWLSCGVAADIQQSYNITSLTDTGTGIVTVTIATDFAAATYSAQVSVEKINTTLTEANERIGHVRNATRAAGSVAFDCNDTTTTTNLTKDPTTWHVALFGDQ